VPINGSKGLDYNLISNKHLSIKLANYR